MLTRRTLYACVYTRVSSGKEKSFRENFAFLSKKNFSCDLFASFSHFRMGKFSFISRNFASICSAKKMRNFREIENAKISRKNYLYDILGKYEFMNPQDFIANIEISRVQNISWKHFYVHPLHIRKI